MLIKWIFDRAAALFGLLLLWPVSVSYTHLTLPTTSRV